MIQVLHIANSHCMEFTFNGSMSSYVPYNKHNDIHKCIATT